MKQNFIICNKRHECSEGYGCDFYEGTISPHLGHKGNCYKSGFDVELIAVSTILDPNMQFKIQRNSNG